MSSPYKQEPDLVAEKIIERTKISRMARRLQNRLALAQFKTNRGWEDLPLSIMEKKVEGELRRTRPTSSGDLLSDSSSSSAASDLPYANSRTLMSSPLKSSTFFSDQIGSSGGSSGQRKRIHHNSFDRITSSSGSRKRFRSSPSRGANWKDNHQLAQSSPLKPHFRASSYAREHVHSINFAAPSDDEDDALPTHSFDIRSSPPHTPPPRHRGGLDRARTGATGGEEGADLLLFLATSPSPANPSARARMQPPSTPPPRTMALPSSMMTTPGGGGSGFLSVFGGPNTPSQTFDFADFVNITPSPGQRAWPKTPGGKTPASIRTPRTIARRNLSFENFLPSGASPGLRDRSTSKSNALGLPLSRDHES